MVKSSLEFSVDPNSDLELMAILPEFPECWDDRHEVEGRCFMKANVHEFATQVLKPSYGSQPLLQKLVVKVWIESICKRSYWAHSHPSSSSPLLPRFSL